MIPCLKNTSHVSCKSLSRTCINKQKQFIKEISTRSRYHFHVLVKDLQKRVVRVFFFKCLPLFNPFGPASTNNCVMVNVKGKLFIFSTSYSVFWLIESYSLFILYNMAYTCISFNFLYVLCNILIMNETKFRGMVFCTNRITNKIDIVAMKFIH